MADFKKIIKNLIIFKEPKQTENFILKEKSNENVPKTNNMSSKKTQKTEKGKKRKTIQPNKVDEINKNSQKQDADSYENKYVSPNLSENLDYIKKIYSIPINGDMILREFQIPIKDKLVNAFIIFYDGLTDRNVINQAILQPLMLLSNLDIKNDSNDAASYISNQLLPQNQLTISKEYQKIINQVNFGGCALFVDGVDKCFIADVKGWEHRGVERPNNEIVIKGPQESFNEILRANTALIRKILKDEDLIAEDIIIGKRSRTPCSMLYIKDITNNALVDEVRKRLKNVKVDYIMDSGELEQLIEDNTLISTPQIISTERPDKIASYLAEGKVAVVLNGSPFVLAMPATLSNFIHSPEDSYIRFPYANLLRVLRIIAVIFSLLLPGIYVAITNYHQEMIPTDLLFAIEASREQVPFPSVVEILIMEFAFELIREAGIRIPGPIGPTLGIIGALILGQAAVAANIISPILIIIVAVTGIGSFAIPNFSLAFSFRIIKFIYIFLGAIGGFLGITLGIFLHVLFLVNIKSFGVPFMTPFAPVTSDILSDQITRPPIWENEKRPDALNTKDIEKQPHISRQWENNKKKGNDNEK